MPNYNYRSNDYMRRCQYPRQMQATAARTDREYSSSAEEISCNCCVEEHSYDYCLHDLLKGLPVAMAFISWQEWQNLHSAEKSLCRGTIFKDLDKPFLGMGGCQK